MSSLPPSSCMTITTFNMLAPCYKRLYDDNEREYRERECETLWMQRLQEIISQLESMNPLPDILLLQEVWFEERCLDFLRSKLEQHYEFHLARHPQPKQDGVATLILRGSPFVTTQITKETPIQYITLPENPDRVCLGMPLRLCNTSLVWLYNVHVTFPHSKYHSEKRDEEVQQIISHSLSKLYNMDMNMEDDHETSTVLIAGDFNADTDSKVSQFFRNNQFVNCYTEINGENSYPVTHRNHRKESLFVDHMFLKSKMNMNNHNDELDMNLNMSPTTTAPTSPTISTIPVSVSPPITPRATATNNPASIRGEDLKSESDEEEEDEEEEDEEEEDELRIGRGQEEEFQSDIDNDEHYSYQSDSNSTLSGCIPTTLNNTPRSIPLSTSSSSLTISIPPPSLPIAIVSSKVHNHRSRREMVTLQPVTSCVYPENMNTKVWPTSFTCSDHRPVSIQFKITQL